MEAAQEAIECPLLNLSIRNARGILLSLTGGQDLTLDKVNSAGALVAGSVKDKPRMILGTTIDRALEDQVQLTLIATGL
jgi:cell division protein FtsZ